MVPAQDKQTCASAKQAVVIALLMSCAILLAGCGQDEREAKWTKLRSLSRARAFDGKTWQKRGGYKETPNPAYEMERAVATLFPVGTSESVVKGRLGSPDQIRRGLAAEPFLIYSLSRVSPPEKDFYVDIYFTGNWDGTEGPDGLGVAFIVDQKSNPLREHLSFAPRPCFL